MRVVLYSNANECPLCDDARAALARLRPRLGFEFTEVRIDGDPRLAIRHALRVPVIEADGVEVAFGKVDPVALEGALRTRGQGPTPSVHSAPEVRVSAAGQDPSTPAPAPAGKPAPTPAPTPTSSSGNKLSEALGFGPSAAPAPSIPLPGGAAREPRRAFTGPVPGAEGGGADAPATSPMTSPMTSTGAGAVPDTPPFGRPTPPPDAMVRILGGTFLLGEDRRTASVAEFEIDRDPVTNGDYERFVLATGHRPPLYWRSGRCPEDLRDHPVVGVDAFDALAYARWAGKDLPYEDEWERAARGTDGRMFPWGDEPDLAANTARTGLKMTLPVGFYPKNASPDGCRDMVGNAWEITLTPAPGGGVVVRGGSWFDFALYAKTYFRSSARVDARNGTIGFRCVRRASPRTDAPRAVVEGEVEAAIAARKHKGELPDPSAWNPDRRDLVPDVRRLRAVVASRDEEAGVEPRPAAGPSPARPIVRKAFVAPAAAAPVAAPAPAMPPAPVAAPVAPPATKPVIVAPKPAMPAAAAPAVVAPAAPKPAMPAMPAAAAAPAVASRPPVVGIPPLPAAPAAATPAPASAAPLPTDVARRPMTAPSAPTPAAAAPSTPAPRAAVPAPTSTPAVPTVPSAPAAVPPAKLPVAPLNPLATPTSKLADAAAAARVPTAPPAPASVNPAVTPAVTPMAAPAVAKPPVVPTTATPAAIPAAPKPPPATAAVAPAAPAAAAAAASAAPKAPPPTTATPTSMPSAPSGTPLAVKSPSAPTPAVVPPAVLPAPAAAAPATVLPPATATSPAAAAAKPAAAPTGPVAAAASSPSKPSAPIPAPIAGSATTPAASTTPAVAASKPVPPTATTSSAPAPVAAPPSVPSPAPAAASTTTARAAAFRQAADEASRAVSAPATSTSSSSTAEPTPSPLRFALLVMALLAAAVFAVVGVLNAGRSAADAVEDDPVRLRLPELVATAADATFPVPLSGGSLAPDLALLERGVVLLVFADGSRASGVETARLGVEMHRRLRAYEVRTVVVLPREVVTSDRNADEAAIKEKLKVLGIEGDVAVLLDPPDDRAASHMRRVRWQVADANAAVVLQDGVELMRVLPPSSDGPLLRAHLAPLVLTAANVGGLRPPEPEGDGGNGNREGDDAGPTALDRPARSPVAPPAMDR